MISRRAIAALAFALAAISLPAIADRSPGPLSSAHQALEGDDHCADCHEGGKNLANDKCLGCHDHEPLRRRIAERKGFHASEKAAGKPCYLCHTEHKGRGKDITGFAIIGGPQRFDHALAGWPLVGAHASTKCEQCHTKRGSYLNAPTACEGCHQSPHGALRASLRKCERCHSQKTWDALPNMQFDHSSESDARFSVDGKHEGLPCAKCHAKNVFRTAGAAPDCTPCHSNPHTGSLLGGRRCDACHAAINGWTDIRFDHARQARFPLEGKHAKAPCEACHQPSKPKLSRACESCHPGPHADRFAKFRDCGSCHTAKSWQHDMRFDHKRQAGFALTGKHALVECRACHRGSSPTEFERFDGIVTPAGVACMSCHRHADVHKKQFKDDECLRCHLGGGKKQFKAQAVEGFHGAGSRFPLTEGHEGVACDQCHKNDVYQGTPTECGGACHEDRLHKGSLGDKCSRCHEGAHWQATRFSHDDTSYPLVGHHQDVACELCHAQKVYKPTPRRCAECHKQDDAHKGTLGDACEQCHSPTGRSLFDHNDPAAPLRFRLEGAHLQAACKSCHPSTVFARAPTACEGCHAEPAKHKGQLGTQCAGCHDVTSWTQIHTGHDVAVGFEGRFGGAHDRVACVECHRGGRPLSGTGGECIACHRKDDIHHNSLGPSCGECHGQSSFAGAQVRFFHERTGCDLRGLHRVLPCLDCHVGGNFAALSPTCVSCHRDDALRAAREGGAAPASHMAFTTCSNCHNVNYWRPARAAGRESVCQ